MRQERRSGKEGSRPGEIRRRTNERRLNAQRGIKESEEEEEKRNSEAHKSGRDPPSLAVKDVIGHPKQADRDDQWVCFDDFSLNDLVTSPF